MDRIAEETTARTAQVLALRRTGAGDARDRRVGGVHAAHPELAKIADELAIAGSALVLEAIDPARPTQARDRMIALEEARSTILREAAIPADYDHIRPVCSRCGDTGRLDGGPFCSCRNELFRAFLLEASELGPLSSYSFDAFDDTLFDEQVNGTRDRADVSPRVQIQGIRNACQKFVLSMKKGTTDNRDLLFTGMPGTGKTCMAACVANAVMDSGLSVRYLPAPRLFAILDSYRTLCSSFRPDEDRLDEAERDYATILESRLLIIDDLGTEPLKAATLPDLLQILDQRHGAGLRTLFCTNAEPTSLQKLYDERLWSRMAGRCNILRFFGDDLRIRAARVRRRTPHAAADGGQVN